MIREIWNGEERIFWIFESFEGAEVCIYRGVTIREVPDVRRDNPFVRIAEYALREPGNITAGVSLYSLEIDRRSDYRFRVEFRARLTNGRVVLWSVDEFDIQQSPLSYRSLEDTIRDLVARLAAEVPIVTQITAIERALEQYVMYSVDVPSRAVVQEYRRAIDRLQGEFQAIWSPVRIRPTMHLAEAEIPVGMVLGRASAFIEPPPEMRADVELAEYGFDRRRPDGVVELPPPEPPAAAMTMTMNVEAIRRAIDQMFDGAINRLGQASGSAYARAEQLLLEWLTPEQRRDFEKDNVFYVTGSHTGARYRIVGATGAFNVADISDGRLLCFGPALDRNGRQLPRGDVLLTQKLALELHEDRVLEVANVSDLRSRWPGVGYADIPF